MTHEKEKYERIKELKKREYSMKFNSLEDFYAFVAGVLSTMLYLDLKLE